MFEKVREIERRRAAGELDEEGFTLIELLIVIVVLGILAAVVVFALGGTTAQTAVAACNTDAKSVETAVAAFNANTGSFPTAAITGSADSTPLTGGTVKYLQTWPNSTHYSITVAALTGVVSVTTKVGTVPTTQAYDTQTSTTGCNAAT